MIKHVLFFNLKEQAEGQSKAENLAKIKSMIEALNGKIPGLIRIEIGADYSATEASADMILYSEFESREALAVYADHPDHLVAKTFIQSVCSARQLVDYEV